MSLYSQRNTPPPSQLRYDVPPESVRTRIVAILKHYVTDTSWLMFLHNLQDLLLRQYGQLSQSSDVGVRRSKIRVIDHFFTCHDEQALDFVEACFRLNMGIGGQDAVDEINQVLRQEGLGYELTQCVAGPHVPGSIVYGGPAIPEEQYPRIIRIDHQLVHDQVVAPSLELLRNPILAVANKEMLKAYADHRLGRYDDAITACGSAFESVLKTICDQKGWQYNADKDTCSALVDACRKNNLFPSFYVELFKGVGTVRNKLGDVHGRGPTPSYDVEAAHAEHMLHVTSAHVLLLCKLAGLE